MSNNNNTLIELTEHVQFQSLLAELSAGFVRISPDKVDQEIQNSLQRIAENLDFDQISLGMITADSHDFYSKHTYAKSGAKPWEAESLMSEAPYVTRIVLGGQSFIMHDVDELPAEAAKDREGFLRYGIRAQLIFPFIVGGHLTGGIGFASARSRQWSDAIVRGLGLIADVFANVLERQMAVQTLQVKEEQMRLAAEAGNIGLWVWNIPQDTIWATEIARKLYGVMDHEELNLQRFLDCLHSEDRHRVSATVQRLLQGETEFRDEYRVVHPDNSEHWICASGRCLVGADGQPEQLMGASLNITEFRRIQLALEQSNSELNTALEEIHHLKDQVQQENIYLRHEISGRQELGKIIYGSPAMRLITRQIEQVAPTPASVLILGETGTGKELLATAIHNASPRKDRPMIRVNCAAIPAALIESELFGREKGAYTGALSKQIGRFELAHGSTLFLDEIGELPLDSQAKILRALQEKEIERLGSPKSIKVDVRVIAATNRNLAQEVAEGRFREDLYYRLNVFPIQVPPLRDRREDIPKLVEMFIDEFARAMDKSIDVVAKSSLQALCNYDWPGNIRELRNVIERAVILSRSPVLKISLPDDALTSVTPTHAQLLSLEEVEREHILRVLDSSGWRVRGQGGAAAILGLKPSTLESRMIKLGIRRPSSS
ncbi:MAG: sigma 54-interacting transcriptional regulator [Methylococcaceae bacterium]|nr:sigma 54-interacting transcriptional regulator [Methylococcaceae bacterium]MDZ4156186.1 sigma 54-interacting transcriptional regulator [Methylococcales bacterium]MDP2393764.1 sigma 54-interacting transcriptional regulator [Methylococcaceae bacterium]MDP3019790.1 sigma 54-interacting transcriptional regulator [Methylococcaceae bacterium]MDP3389605.1 sigma 54-interacting transcriptional regulator [Methylococcaceae bacterium]